MVRTHFGKGNGINIYVGREGLTKKDFAFWIPDRTKQGIKLFSDGHRLSNFVKTLFHAHSRIEAHKTHSSGSSVKQTGYQLQQGNCRTFRAWYINTWKRLEHIWPTAAVCVLHWSALIHQSSSVQSCIYKSTRQRNKIELFVKNTIHFIWKYIVFPLKIRYGRTI